jgi:ABC-2 type transport system permease protein
VVRKTQFPRLVIPLAVVLTSLFNLGLNLIVVFIFILAWGVDPTWTWLLFPVILGLLFVLTTAVSMIVSSLYPRFRDTLIIWSVAATVLFYATPVLYPMEVVERTSQILHDVLLINPLAPIFELARSWIIDPSAPGPVEVAGGFARLLPAIGIYLGICLFAVWTFNREAPRIAEQL